MASGLPMIVTDVGGNAEAVLDGECGIVVPPHDPARLADAIVRLANDPSLRARFGSAGRRRMAEHFALDRSIGAYDVLYRALQSGVAPGDIRRGSGHRLAAPDLHQRKPLCSAGGAGDGCETPD